jgi:hypothetical protein
MRSRMRCRRAIAHPQENLSSTADTDCSLSGSSAAAVHQHRMSKTLCIAVAAMALPRAELQTAQELALEMFAARQARGIHLAERRRSLEGITALFIGRVFKGSTCRSRDIRMKALIRSGMAGNGLARTPGHGMRIRVPSSCGKTAGVCSRTCTGRRCYIAASRHQSGRHERWRRRPLPTLGSGKEILRSSIASLDTARGVPAERH